MKKIFLTLAIALTVQLTMAQDASFKEDAMKVIKSSGAAGPMEMVKEQLMNSIPEGKKEEFSKDFDNSLPKLYEKIATIYMETYTHDDIKKMLEFYESPVGKKISENTGKLYQKSTVASQEWGMQLQSMMMKYME